MNAAALQGPIAEATAKIDACFVECGQKVRRVGPIKLTLICDPDPMWSVEFSYKGRRSTLQTFHGELKATAEEALADIHENVIGFLKYKLLP